MKNIGRMATTTVLASTSMVITDRIDRTTTARMPTSHQHLDSQSTLVSRHTRPAPRLHAMGRERRGPDESYSAANSLLSARL